MWTSALSIGATSLLLLGVPAKYEARTLVRLSTDSVSASLPSWLKQDVSPQEFYVTQTGPTPEQAVMKANRLASFFVQKNHARPQESDPTAPLEKRPSVSSSSNSESIQKQIRELETHLQKPPAADVSVERLQNKEQTELLQALRERPETVLTPEQVDQLGLAKGEYLSYHASLQDRDEMGRVYGPLHPKWQQQESKEALRKSEFLKALEKLSSSVSLPSEEEPSVDTSLTRKQIEFLQTLLTREQESAHEQKTEPALAARTKDSSLSPTAQITQFALLPEHPIFPKWPETIGFSFLLSLFAGGIVSAYDRRYRRKFLGPEELEEELGFPCFGSLSGRDILLEEPADTILRTSGAEIVAKVKALRTVLSMLGTREGKKPKVFLVTSDTCGSSAALLATWLGRLAVRGGEKVLLIDADFHQASLGKFLKLNPERTLPDYLAGQGRLDDVLDRSVASDLHVIAATKVPHSAADLLSSDRMKNLICSFSQFYDAVIIVAPLGPSYPEGLALASLADQGLLCVSAKTSSRQGSRALVHPLLRLGFKNMCSIFLEDFPS